MYSKYLNFNSLDITLFSLYILYLIVQNIMLPSNDIDITCVIYKAKAAGLLEQWWFANHDAYIELRQLNQSKQLHDYSCSIYWVSLLCYMMAVTISVYTYVLYFFIMFLIVNDFYLGAMIFQWLSVHLIFQLFNYNLKSLHNCIFFFFYIPELTSGGIWWQKKVHWT